MCGLGLGLEPVASPGRAPGVGSRGHGARLRGGRCSCDQAQGLRATLAASVTDTVSPCHHTRCLGCHSSGRQHPRFQNGANCPLAERHTAPRTGAKEGTRPVQPPLSGRSCRLGQTVRVQVRAPRGRPRWTPTCSPSGPQTAGADPASPGAAAAPLAAEAAGPRAGELPRGPLPSPAGQAGRVGARRVKGRALGSLQGPTQKEGCSPR